MTKRRNTHFRELQSYLLEEEIIPEDFNDFFEEDVLPSVDLNGYKISEKKRIALHCIHHLVLTGLRGACVSDSRRKVDSGVSLRIQVWDAIIAAGFAKACKGSESSGKVTRYRATSKLLDIRKEWELDQLQDLTLQRNTETDEPTKLALIYLHTGKFDLETGRLRDPDDRKRLISIREEVNRSAQRGLDGQPDPRAIENGLQYLRKVEDIIERINFANTSHTWQAWTVDENGRRTVFPANPCLRQVHVGKFFQAARLYTYGKLSAQNLSEDQRKEMLIDGKPTAELDFSGMAPRMLYHRERIAAAGDVYQPEKVFPRFYGFENATKSKKATVRGFIKRATNICLNTKTVAAASAAINKLLREHDQQRFLGRVIYRVEDSNPNDIVRRLETIHEPIARHFFTGVGIELMTTDGRIMLRILSAFADAAKPALGIHDSVVCRRSDATFAEQTMIDAYRQHMQFEPTIKRVY